jgi:hypothetical protein
MNKRNFLPLLLLLTALTACNLPVSRPGAPTEALATLPPTTPPLPSQPSPATPTAFPPTPYNPTSMPPPVTTQPPPAATQPPSPTLPPASTGPYAVILVAPGDSLNIRQGPGVDSTIIDRLPPNAAGFSSTGRQTPIGDQRWMEIVRAAGGTGWVNAAYLTEYITPANFCADARLTTLLAVFDQALNNKDGQALASLVSPTHGLRLTYLRTGHTAEYSPAEARWLFESTYVMDWGIHPASGMDIKGTFHETVLPDLLDVMNSAYTTACDAPDLGGGNYTYQWPDIYRNINYLALQKPGTPGVELDWRTWLAGIEYVGGKPYLFSLVHLFWEP